MILLNLLPEKKRLEYELIQSARFLISFFLILLCITTAAALLLAVAHRSLRLRVEKIFRPQATNDAITLEFEERVQALNTLVSTVDAIQERSPAWSRIFIDLTERAPSAITLTTISIDASKNLDLRGHVATRNDLLEFRNRLEQSPFLTDIEFPPTNLLESTSITFEIHARVKMPL